MGVIFNRNNKVRCIRASEVGIPIKEGETYTVASVFEGKDAPTTGGDGRKPGMECVPGVTLKEVAGCFTADRFELVE